MSRLYLYVWLKENAPAEFRSLQTKGKISQKFTPEPEEETGRLRFYIDKDWLEMEGVIKTIPVHLIERVTCHDTIYRGFLPDGIYRYGRAEMLVVTRRFIHHSDGHGFGQSVVPEVEQKVSVCAPTFQELREIYTTVRQSKLMPEELWADEPICQPPHEAGYEEE